jgi:two-component system, OmpR family, sensor kinase
MRHIARSLSQRARLTVWYSLVLATVLGVFAIAIVWQQGRLGLRRVDRELDSLEATLLNVLRDEVMETSDPRAAAEEVRTTMALPNRAMAILDREHHVLSSSWNGLQLNPETIAAREGPNAWTAETPAGAWRVHVEPAAFDGYTFDLLIAAPLDEAMRERREAAQAMLIGIPIVLLLAVGGGLWLATTGPVVAQLREALRAQRQFMADASHELRTPVSVIQSAADVTLGRDERRAEEYREAIAIIGTEAKRLGRLVDDMLVLARADAGGYPLRRENLYLSDLVSECQRAVEILARERGVAIRTSAAGDVPFCGDENLLRRMLLNLLQNAVTHTREGGTVTVDVSPNGRDACIRVQDDGDGIPQADRARIFDRFVQLDAARRGAGAGLGLPIARWIAEVHGGSLELEDSRASGSTFRVELPIRT